MDLGLDGKRAFVAGASSGLGLAVATALAREGCNVALCSRSDERLEVAKKSIVQETGSPSERIHLLNCDVTNEEDVIASISEAASAMGGLNILVTNAGGPPTGLISDFDSGAWREGLDLNLMSTINLCRHALPFLVAGARDEGHGRIIMVTSIAAKQPIQTLYLSNTARAGVQGFAKTLSEEVGHHGITVNTVLPGFTRTARLQHLVEDLQARTGQTAEEVESGWAESAALRRLGEPEEFAAVVAFLASKPAAFITGSAIPIDGGFSKHVF